MAAACQKSLPRGKFSDIKEEGEKDDRTKDK
jgi:hypothetical protein